MARKNLKKFKDIFDSLSDEIRRYGEEGENDLEDLLDTHRPDVLFNLPDSPERTVRMAQLLAEMREVRRELASHQPDEGLAGGSVQVSIINTEITGVYDGFRYALAQLPNGKWVAKITKRGRQILDDPNLPNAPLIVGNPELNKQFKNEEAAEVAVHRVIRKALIWYDEQGIAPPEKRRKTEIGRSGIHLRASGQVAERDRQSREKASKESEERRREKIRSAKREARVKRLDRPPRSSVTSSPGRKLVYIPKKNPSKPFSFIHSESDAIRQGKASVQKFEEWRGRWNDSLKSKNPDFKAVFKAYDHITNALSNFIIAGELDLASKAENIQRELRYGILDILKSCLEFRRNKQKDKKLDHEDVARSHMILADNSWNKYSESKRFSDLLKAYKHLEIAKEYFSLDGYSDGAQQAQARIKLIKQEIKNHPSK